MTDLEQFIATCEAHAVPDSEIDFSDIPELTDEQIAQMKPGHLVNQQPRREHRGCCSHKVVAVGFNTLCYDASVGVLNPPHE